MKIKVIIFIALLIGILALSGYFVIYTQTGSQFAAEQMISQYVEGGDVDINVTEGNLGSGLTLENVEVRNIRHLPEGSVLRVQKLFLNLTAIHISGLVVEAENIRLKLPNSDPVVVSGSFKDLNLDFNVHSKGFTVTEVISYLPDLKKLVPGKGEVADIDLYVTGHYLEPIVRGEFIIEEFVYQGFVLTQCPLKLDIQLKEIDSDVKIFGNAQIDGGQLETKRVAVKLEQGDLNFNGPWDQPEFHIKGSSKVEKTKISIALKGTLEKPELLLNSEPPYPSEKLMVMLATGKSWQSFEDPGAGSINSAALTRDFIDYFFFAGKSNKFAEKFGISDFSVTIDQNQKGIAAKKGLTDNLEVGYGVVQTKAGGREADSVSRKLEGELKVTDSIKVGVERETTTQSSTGAFEESINQNDDKVLIEYKKSF